ncbi:MAG: [FeFe] hydrogenase H-cluster maturation GTPase HydF [Oscillospiraceae bacterium]|nr:[FeFe] hydrogenase H-cluster maturation GTPase HydF [Oscillospiraceae bacterium]
MSSGMNQTPSGERVHIAFFGRRNAGKSSLVNAFTGQELAIVSDVRGTTTDPVYKAMELLPLGPVQIIDTPGIDDEGALGEKRIKKTRGVLNKTDLAIIVTDAPEGLDAPAAELLELVRDKALPYIIVHNKSDLLPAVPPAGENEIWVSAKTRQNIMELKELAAKKAETDEPRRRLISDLLEPGDTVVLVIPIDKAAPKGRIILPQQQVLRDTLEAGASALVCRNTELADTLNRLTSPPKMVVTDSQAFEEVSRIVPESVTLTSFSILMARYKGDLDLLARGAMFVDSLHDGSKVLISEGCTHHRQCDDIGTVKLPRWIEAHTGVKPQYFFTSGTEFTETPEDYDYIIHCGACMLGEREVAHRIRSAAEKGVPITNYGTLIAHLNGILTRCLSFQSLAAGS